MIPTGNLGCILQLYVRFWGGPVSIGRYKSESPETEITLCLTNIGTRLPSLGMYDLAAIQLEGYVVDTMDTNHVSAVVSR